MSPTSLTYMYTPIIPASLTEEPHRCALHFFPLGSAHHEIVLEWELMIRSTQRKPVSSGSAAGGAAKRVRRGRIEKKGLRSMKS